MTKTRRNFKSTIIVTTLIAFVMLVTFLVPSINVHAAGIRYNSINTSTSWKTIATASSGFDCNVDIGCTNFSNVPCYIRMLNSKGSVILEESGAIKITSMLGSGGYGSRTFWCGSDVYTIQIRIQSGTGTAIATQG